LNNSQRDLWAWTAFLRRRLNMAVWIHACLRPLTIFFTAWAGLLILVKMIMPGFINQALWPGLAIPFILAEVHVLCLKKRRYFDRNQSLEAVDHLFRDDGSVTACYERPELLPGEIYTETVRKAVTARAPRICWNLYLKPALPSLLFLTAALTLPQRRMPAHIRESEFLDTILSPAIEEISENRDLFSPEEQKELENLIEELREKNEGISREQWEAVEEIRDRIETTAEDKRQALMQMIRDTDGVLNQSAEHDTPSSNSAFAEAFEKTRMKLEQQISRNPLSAETQARLQEMLSGMKQCENAGEMRNALQELRNALSHCSSTGAGERYRIGEPEEGESGGPDAEGNLPGSGGVNRGRGDAPLVQGPETTLPDAAFEQKRLENRVLVPEDLVDMGIQTMEPLAEPGVYQPAGVRSPGDISTGHSGRIRISPGQRDAVSRYFDDEKEK